MVVLTKPKSKKGFSLVELIVIISIMAVLALVVAGPILSYVERSRAKKDFSQASEIVQAVEMSLNDFEVFDEVETQKIKTNVSCYVDSNQESTYTPLITNETADNKQYTFDDDSRKLDESPYYAAGNMDGFTITFEPKASSGNKTEYELADAVINKYAYGNSDQKLSDASPKLYQKLVSVLGDTFEQESQTYRNSEYTVFVNTDTVEDETGLVLDAVNCYGQYDGTNLSLRDYPSTDVNITIDRENGAPSVPVEHKHNYTQRVVAPTCANGGYTEYRCACGKYYISDPTKATGHKFKPYKVDPTCIATGKSCEQCASCGMIRNETVLPMVNHDYQTHVVKPTCYASGHTEYTCRNCGNSYIDKKVGALGHDYKEIKTDPTCTKPGLLTYECSRCHDKKDNTTVPALGHQWSIKQFPPTCEQDGYIEKTCDRCGQVENEKTGNKIEHNYNPGNIVKYPTCTTTGIREVVCSTCGNIKTEEIKALGHDMTGKRKEPTCTQTGVSFETCRRCGHSNNGTTIPALGHDYQSTVIKPTCQHEGYTEKTCIRCGNVQKTNIVPATNHQYNVWTVVKSATCTAAGERISMCVHCGYQIKETDPALGHNMKQKENPATCEQSGMKYKECARCLIRIEETIINALGHSYTTKVIAPTCLAEGYTLKECTRCGQSTRTNLTAKIPHKYVSWTVTKQPTCMESGTKQASCAMCNTIATENIAPAGHQYKQVSVGATCTNGGSAYKECSACHDRTPEEFVPPLGHDWIEKVIAPTCKNEGYTQRTCKRCAHEETANRVPAVAHNPSSWTTTKEPTCTADGLRSATCSMCHQALSEKIPALGHNYVIRTIDPTCIKAGQTREECSRCGDLKGTPIILEKLPHNYVDDVTPPTCEKGGQTTHTCTMCGHSYTDSQTDKIGHKFEWHQTAAPTCLKEGSEFERCTMCGTIGTTRAIPKLPHKAGKTEIKNPTFDVDGYKKVTCASCGNEISNEILPKLSSLTAYALLLDDNSLHFIRSKTPFKVGDSFENYGTIQEVYTGLEDPFNIQMMGVVKAPWIDRANQNRHKATSITFHHIVKPTMTNEWFMNYQGSTIKGFKNLDTSNVRSMRDMFSGSNFTELNLSHFNTGSVLDMGNMFEGAQRLNGLDVSTFDLHNVQTMSGMFSELRFTKPLILNKFDTSSVRTMDRMFERSHFPALDLSGMKTQSCQTMNNMFASLQLDSGSGILDLTSFDTRNVKNMGFMFEGCLASSINVSSFNTQSVTNMECMFAMVAPQTLDLTSFNTQHVTNAYRMFYNSGMRTIYATDAFDMVREGSEPSCNSIDMFDGCWNLVGGNGTTYSMLHLDGDYAVIDSAAAPGYFTGKKVYGTDVVAIDATNTTNNQRILFVVKGSYSNLYKAISTTKTYNLTDNAFGIKFDAPAPNYTIKINDVDMLGEQEYEIWQQSHTPFEKIEILSRFGQDDLYGGEYRGYEYLFSEFSSVKSITGFELLDFTGVTSLRTMFQNCSSLEQFRINEEIKMPNVESMERMFSGCTKLDDFYINCETTNALETTFGMFENCVNMRGCGFGPKFKGASLQTTRMFYNCRGLEDIRIVGWAAPQELHEMFYNCSNLMQIAATADQDWSTPAQRGDDVFYNCNFLQGTYTSYANYGEDSHVMAKVGTRSNPGYFKLA